MSKTAIIDCNITLSQETPEKMGIESFKLLLTTFSDLINLENELEGAKAKRASKKRLVCYVVTYLFATINLLGITQSIDLNNPIDALKKSPVRALLISKG